MSRPPSLYRYSNITNKKFNKLTAISITSKTKNGAYRWLCKCDCGNETEVTGTDLRQGKVRSCGCLMKRLTPLQAAINTLYNQYRASSKIRKLIFLLTKDEFVEIVKLNCFYCNSSPVKRFNGVDRKDNDIGYIKENCVPCCKFCNYAKKDHSVEEFLNWLERIKNV